MKKFSALVAAALFAMAGSAYGQGETVNVEYSVGNEVTVYDWQTATVASSSTGNEPAFNEAVIELTGTYEANMAGVPALKLISQGLQTLSADGAKGTVQMKAQFIEVEPNESHRICDICGRTALGMMRPFQLKLAVTVGDLRDGQVVKEWLVDLPYSPLRSPGSTGPKAQTLVITHDTTTDLWTARLDAK